MQDCKGDDSESNPSRRPIPREDVSTFIELDEDEYSGTILRHGSRLFSPAPSPLAPAELSRTVEREGANPPRREAEYRVLTEASQSRFPLRNTCCQLVRLQRAELIASPRTTRFVFGLPPFSVASKSPSSLGVKTAVREFGVDRENRVQWHSAHFTRSEEGDFGCGLHPAALRPGTFATWR